jgi:hypothetical protein
MQTRYSSTTQTTAYYGSSHGYQSNGTSYLISSDNASAMTLELLGINFAASVSFDMYITGVGVSNTPKMTFNSTNGFYGKFGVGGMLQASQRTYDGFRLSASTGNISGQVYIYGLGQ